MIWDDFMYELLLVFKMCPVSDLDRAFVAEVHFIKMPATLEVANKFN